MFTNDEYNKICLSFDSYREHARKIEEFLAKEITSFNLSESNDLHHEEDFFDNDDYLETRELELDELTNIFPSIQRKAEIIAVYAVLEYQMQQICKSYERELDTQVRIQDLNSNGILDQCKKYLQKVVSIDFPDKGEFWKEVMKVQQIRNVLVHADGYVKDGNKELLSYIKQSNYLGLDLSGKVIIKSGYSIHCIDSFCAFLTELYLNVNG
ncbi:hypothetical protein A6D98_02995 [Aliivibrio fischeri]|uniref:hypothetical protein n=1 Tax=Aliivibrio fischeri TaxID=668 RepID=UPI00080E587F|nr:hypothetical protein [Aliivibrio fischeri]OCH01406.1 hypothetical protein A6E10_19280 [Aliivibrio fischeri]OCH31891.1 hypothetical protein A6D99_18525 [Aliivibrio fischeri]OCH63284.1 hypothetical protein A6D98_02995 [Aliivibrio fischeri]